mgnify:CR=1 FL=1
MGVLNYKTIYNTSSANNKEIRQRFYMSKLLNVSMQMYSIIVDNYLWTINMDWTYPIAYKHANWLNKTSARVEPTA